MRSQEQRDNKFLCSCPCVLSPLSIYTVQDLSLGQGATHNKLIFPPQLMQAGKSPTDMVKGQPDLDNLSLRPPK